MQLCSVCAVSRSGRVRNEIRQGRADARFVRGIWLGKTTESDEHLFATDTGVYTTRTQDTEQRRADLVKFAKNVMGQACRKANGKNLARQPLKHRPLRPTPLAKASERPSEDASERRSAKAQDLTPPAVPHVMWNTQDRVKQHCESSRRVRVVKRYRAERSEYYAVVTTTAEALHLQRLLEFLGMPVKLRLRINSTAACGIIQRQGCGPLKHIETRLLWLQA